MPQDISSLVEYIKTSLTQKIPKETVEANLYNRGWQKSQIDQAFAQVQTPKEKSSYLKFLLIAGLFGLLLVIIFSLTYTPSGQFIIILALALIAVSLIFISKRFHNKFNFDKSKKEPKGEIIILRFIIGLILLFLLPFLFAPLLIFLLVTTKSTHEIIAAGAYYSSVFLVSFSPLVFYIAKWVKHLFKIWVVLIILITVVILSLPTLGIFGFGKPELPNRIERINKLIADDKTLYIKDNGLYTNELFSKPIIPASIWTYKLPDGDFIDLTCCTKEAASIEQQFKNLDEKLSKDELALVKVKIHAGEIGSPGFRKEYRVQSNSIVVKVDDYENPYQKIIKRLKNKTSDGRTSYWTWDKYQYIFTTEEKANRTVMYRINMISDEVLEVDSIPKVLDSSRANLFYKDEIIIYSPYIPTANSGITDVLIFNTVKNKFTLNFKVSGSYDSIFYQHPHFIFLYKRNISPNPDGVLMIDKRTGEIVKKFVGK